MLTPVTKRYERGPVGSANLRREGRAIARLSLFLGADPALPRGAMAARPALERR